GRYEWLRDSLKKIPIQETHERKRKNGQKDAGKNNRYHRLSNKRIEGRHVLPKKGEAKKGGEEEKRSSRKAAQQSQRGAPLLLFLRSLASALLKKASDGPEELLKNLSPFAFLAQVDRINGRSKARSLALLKEVPPKRGTEGSVLKKKKGE